MKTAGQHVVRLPLALALIVVSVLMMATGCVDRLRRCVDAQPGASLECIVPDHVDRAYSLDLPEGWDGTSPLPLVYVFHGGGGNRQSTQSITCPEGDIADPSCLTHRATARGFAIARPDGTGMRPFRNSRTWNGGGGVDDWQCVSGPACHAGVDDMAYFDALHHEVSRAIPVDTSRVFATGISNGAAISHRLACERADILAAIAPVAGTNQFAAAGGSCEGGVAVLQIHGTDDPCWGFEDTTEACLQVDGKLKIGVESSMEGWRRRNGCKASMTTSELPDVADDGTTSTRMTWNGCDQAVELIRIEGGGHTWPGGSQYLGAIRVGQVSHDFDANDVILEFFEAHAR